MKVIAAIHADFERGPLGTRSRLNDELLGETVLRRTLKRVLMAKRISGVHLLVDTSQQAGVQSVVEGLDVKVETHHAGDVPWQTYIACARKWSLDAWRGGISGACVFDESLHPWLLEALAQREAAQGVVDVPAAAPLLDPQLLDAMIEHYEDIQPDVRLTFTQSAPGLSAAIYAPPLLAELVKTTQSPGRSMAYNPADPRRDRIMLPCFYAPDADVRRASGRCIADTDAAVDRIAAILKETDGPDGDPAVVPDALAVSRWLIAHESAEAGSLPGEVEIELTTEDPLPDTTLRPRGSAVGKRGPMDNTVFDRLIDELAGRDDIRVVLGGFGDPLLHPNWPRCARRCREAGIFGVALRTPAVTLDEPAIEALLKAKVDVLDVILDATSPETYRKLHLADHYEQVIANLERLFEARLAGQQPQPLVVCEMIKTHATMDEMEQFYDHWVGNTGSAVLVGPSTYGGQWPDLSVMSMAPPTRVTCSRLFTRASVLADGRVTVCDQDFRGRHAIGSIADTSLAALWSGRAMADVRRSHLEGRYDGITLCPTCQEWHRP